MRDGESGFDIYNRGINLLTICGRLAGSFAP